MKHKTQNYWLLLIPLLFYSCRSTKIINTTTTTTIQPITVVQKEKPNKDFLSIPLNEETLRINFENQQYNDEDVEIFEHNRGGDLYPIYDINNTPISVWFIKKEEKYLGFIVAGHATKAVCEVASIEVHNKFKKIGNNESSIFSFGVGHYIIDEDEWTVEFNETLNSMEEKFNNLQHEIDYDNDFTNNYQVKLGKINYSDYKEDINLIQEHIEIANNYEAWDKHIVEYKLKESPLIVPFYDISTNSKIEFEIPKSTFGEIPGDFAFLSYKKNLEDWKEKLETAIENNYNLIDSLQNSNITDNTHCRRNFNCYKHNDDLLLTETKTLVGNHIHCINWFRWTSKGDTIDITLEEALQTIHTFKDTSHQNILIDWKDNWLENTMQFEENKREIIDEILSETKIIKDELRDHISLIQDIMKQDDQDLIVDAFLRGWIFDMDDDDLNTELDDWYKNYRKSVWDYIFKKIPKAKVEGKLGGIFHADDVYFQVRPTKDTFIITPYKVVGGDFLQIIDKEMGISYLQSPFNFRHN